MKAISSQSVRPILLLLLFIAGIGELDGQSIRVQVEMVRVKYHFPNADDQSGGPDVRWRFGGKVSVNGVDRFLLGGGLGTEERLDRTSASGSFYVGRSMINQKIYLPEVGLISFNPPIFQNNVVLNLCDDIRFTLDFEGRELDGIFGDDYVRTGNSSYTLTDQDAGQWHNFTYYFADGSRRLYSYDMRFRYDLLNQISDVRFTDTQNNAIAAAECQNLRIHADLHPGFSGGRFRFQKRRKGSGGNWQTIYLGSNSYAEITPTDLTDYDLRVGMASTSGCLGDDDGFWSPRADRIPRVVPSFRGSIPYSKQDACAGGSDGSITYDGRNLGDGVRVNLILERWNGSNFNSAANVNDILATETRVFGNLTVGRYKLKASVRGTAGDEQCTSEEEIVIVAKPRPRITSVSATSPACGQPSRGNIRVDAVANNAGRLFFRARNTVTGQEVNSGSISGSRYTFTDLAAGTYTISLSASNGCPGENVKTAIINPTPAAAGGEIRVPDNPTNFDIACTGGSVDVVLDPPNGQGDYVIKPLPDGPNLTVRNNQTRSYRIEAPGTYRFRFTRSNTGCTVERSITISENPTPISASLAVATQPTACMPATGALRAVVANGQSPYVFRLGGQVVTPESESGSTFLFSGLNAGDYQLTVTDARGCSANASIGLPAVSGLNLRASTIQESCRDEGNGVIGLIANGGSPPYSLELVGEEVVAGNQATFTRLSAGNYVGIARDASGCETRLQVNLPQTSPLRILGVETTPIICHGDETQLTVLLSGPFLCGTPPSLLGGSVNDAFEYSLDGGSTFQLAENTNLGDVDCREDFEIYLSLAAANYDLQIRSRPGCLSNVENLSTDFFAEPRPLRLEIDTLTDVSCFGGNDGTIRVSYGGGRGYYRLEIRDYRNDNDYNVLGRIDGVRPGSGSHTFRDIPVSNNLGAGRGYRVVIRDNRNAQGNMGSDISPCSAEVLLGTESQPTINQPAPIVVEEIDLGPPVECDLSNAIVTVDSVSGGTPPYRYQIDNSGFQDTNFLKPLSSFSTLNIIDANNCQSTDIYSLPRNDNSPVVTTEVIRRPTDCAPGLLKMTPTAGTPPYVGRLMLEMGEAGREVIAQDSSMGEAMFFEIPQAGYYFDLVIDSFSCQVSYFNFDGVIIDAGTELGAGTVGKSVESCPGSADGSMTIRPEGGFPPYTIALNGVDSVGEEITFGGLSQGVFNFIIIDSLGCSYLHRDSIGVNANLGLETTTTGGGPCSDSETATIEVIPFGGQPPYTLEWLDPEGFTVDIQADETSSRSGLASWEYTVRLTDANGCSSTFDTYVDGVREIGSRLTITTQPDCGVNGSILPELFGGTEPYFGNVSFNGGPFVPLEDANQFQDLNPGIYIYEFFDDNGCNKPQPDTLIILPRDTQLMLALTPINPACSGEANGSFAVAHNQGGEGFTYRLDGSAPQTDSIFTGLTAGEYVVTVNTPFCTERTLNFTVEENPALSLRTTLVEADTCEYGQFGYLVTATGGTPPYQYPDAEDLLASSAFYAAPAQQTITATVIDASGCEYRMELVGPNTPGISLDSFRLLTPGCSPGDTLLLAPVVSGGVPPYRYEWSDGSTDSLLQTTTTDVYSLTITDARGCTINRDTYLAANPRLNLVLIDAFPTSCGLPGSADGYLNFVMEGGSGQYEFVLEDLINPFTFPANQDGFFPDLASGIFRYTITDLGTGCTLEGLAAVSEGGGPELQVDIITPPNCANQGIGIAEVSTTDGTAASDAFWPMTGDFGDFGRVFTGENFVVATDQGGCYTTYVFTVEQQSPRLVLDSLVQPGCGTTGGASVRVENAGMNPRFTWSNGATTPTLSGLEAGNYSLTYTDDAGCRETLTFLLEGAPELSATISEQRNLGCGVGDDGVTTAIASGGRAPYSFAWSNGDAGPTADSLGLGVHTVTVTDANGCTTVLGTEIIRSTPPILSFLIGLDDACGTEATGAAAVQASGGNPPLAYAWSDGTTEQTIVEANAGTYTVTVTDATGCRDSLVVEIGSTPGPEILLLEQTISGCGEDTISISRVLASGTTGPYYYEWSNGDLGPSADSLAAGIYTVTVTDANECSSSLNVTVAPPQPAQLSILRRTEAGCGPQALGSASIGVTGGFSPYFFRWSSGETTVTAENLPAGQNTVTVTDGLGCETTLDVMIEAAAAPVLSLEEQTDAGCDDAHPATATVSVIGGRPPYDIRWSNGEAGPTASNLTAGLREVTLTDANGCTDTLQVDILEAPPVDLRIVSVVNASCTDGSGSITMRARFGTPPFVFTWSHDAGVTDSVATNLPAGPYAVTVTDAKGCTARFIRLAVGFDEGPLLRRDSVIPATCGGANGGISLGVTGGTGNLTYEWTGAVATGPTASDLAAGTYGIRVFDANECTDSITVIVPATPLPSLTAAVDTAGCGAPTGVINLIVSEPVAPLIYAWAHDDGLTGPRAENLAAGSYPIMITDANGCILMDTFNVIGTPAVVLGEASIIPTACDLNNGSIRISPGGGTGSFTYAWSHDNTAFGPEIQNLPAGTYAVTVTDEFGCSAAGEYELAALEGPAQPTISIQDAICQDGTAAIELTLEPGTENYRIAWSHDDTLSGNIAENLAAGNYRVTVTDPATCGLELNLSVDLLPAPTLNLVPTELLCDQPASGTVSAEINGGLAPFEYQWSNGAVTSGLQNVPAGDYGLTVTDRLGCQAIGTTRIAPKPSPTINIQNSEPVACDEALGSAVFLVTTSGNRPSINFSTSGVTSDEATLGPDSLRITLSDIPAGNHTFSVVGENGCTSEYDLRISTVPLPRLRVEERRNVSCAGAADGGILVGVNNVGDVTYQWGANAGAVRGPRVNDLAPGDYRVTVTTSRGCTDTLTVSIEEPAPLRATETTMINPDCFGAASGSLQVAAQGGTSPYTYRWRGDTLPEFASLSNLPAGEYRAYVEDANGCLDSLTLTLVEPSPVDGTLVVENTSCPEAANGRIAVIPTGGTPPYSYFWPDLPMLSDSLAEELPQGNYSVRITDAAGCTADLPVSLSSDGTSVGIALLTLNAETCLGAGNGQITVMGTGSDGPFTYAWNTGDTTETAADLVGGQVYSVTVTNGFGCTASQSFPLEEGIPLELPTIPADTSVCRGNIFALDLTDYSGASVSGPGGFSSSEPVVLLEVAGTYTIGYTNPLGCSVSQELRLTVGTEPLTARMVLPSDMVLADTLLVLETSFPEPDMVEWVIDESRVRITDRVDNLYYFTFTEAGTYAIGMIASREGCSDAITKEVVVHPDSTSIPSANLGAREILALSASPNPTQGQFTVLGELASAQPVFFSLFRETGEELDQRRAEGSTVIFETYNLDLLPGSYFLQVQAGRERRVILILVQ